MGVGWGRKGRDKGGEREAAESKRNFIAYEGMLSVTF